MMRKSPLSILVLAVVVLFVSVSASAQELDRQIEKLAEEITREYLKTQDEMLLKPRIGIPDFEEETETAARYSVGSLTAALMTEKLSRSTVFSIIERRNLENLMEEYKLSLSGFIDEETAPQIGQIHGVELLLLGSVGEIDTVYLITARLVEVETGVVITSSSIRVGRDKIEEESEQYIASTFQSRYGITLSPNSMAMFEIGGNGNKFELISVDVGYRVFNWLSFSIGYAHMQSNEMSGLDKEIITVTDDKGSDYTDITRYFRFSGDGIKLGINTSLSLSPRFSINSQISAVAYTNATLEQDFPGFPVWQPDGSEGLEIVQDRILVNGYRYSSYLSYHLNFSGEYLISRRLSFFSRVGFFILPEFIPVAFESGGSVRADHIKQDSDIDENGTFPQYQSYNFSRNSFGERVGFSAMGVSIQVGVAVHF